MNRFMLSLTAVGAAVTDAEMRETKTHKLPYGLVVVRMLVTSKEHVARWGEDSKLFLDLRWRAGVSQRGPLKIRKGLYLWVSGSCEPKMLGRGEKRKLHLDVWVDQWMILGLHLPSVRSGSDPRLWTDVVDVNRHTKSDGSVPEQVSDTPATEEKTEKEP